MKYPIQHLLGGDWTRLLAFAAGGNAEELVLGPGPDVSIEMPNYVESHPNNKCPRIVVIESPSKPQREKLQSLERLRFLCKGTITVFPFPALTPDLRTALRKPRKLFFEEMMPMMSPYYAYVGGREPQWLVEIEGSKRFARSAVVMMLYSDERGDKWVWTVWDQESQEWSFPGGNVNRVMDQTLLGTAEREWDEEVLGFPFAVARDASVHPIVLPFLPKAKSARFPVQVYVCCRATREFFLRTSASRFQFAIPPGALTNADEEQFRRLNADPEAKFVEHEWAAWTKFDGRLLQVPAYPGFGPKGDQVRWENPAVMRLNWGAIQEKIFGRPAFGGWRGKGNSQQDVGGKGKGKKAHGPTRRADHDDNWRSR